MAIREHLRGFPDRRSGAGRVRYLYPFLDPVEVNPGISDAILNMSGHIDWAATGAGQKKKQLPLSHRG
ncbi:MAG: hypothetical protein ACWGPR_10125 [Candidatus Deferrimicrobiaceae bacterium]